MVHRTRPAAKPLTHVPHSIADTLGPYDVYGGNADAAARTGAQWGVDDPMLVVSAMAAVSVASSLVHRSSV